MKHDIRQPLVQEIPYFAPMTLFTYFAQTPWLLFLDSANPVPPVQPTHRFSYLAIDPFQKIILQQGIEQISGTPVTQPFAYLKTIMAAYTLERIAELPPFQGGVAGYMAYDLCHYLEAIPPAKQDAGLYPDLALAVYDLVYAFDHVTEQAWIFSAGWPEQSESRRMQRARQRLQQAQIWVRAARDQQPPGTLTKPQFLQSPIQSNFTRAEYINMVSKAKEYIRAGDIFEVNVAQRYTATLVDHVSTAILYEHVRKTNPAPFSAFLQFDDIALLSTSPERFIQIHDAHVETRPIKGTAKRSLCQREDAVNALALQTNAKERAENIMIVDLMRNDLSRVCTDNSVNVTQLCQLETFATVHHLVSVIQATLLPDKNAFDVLQACMPGGSITGAPKIRAMHIIAELEPNHRGPYCGCMGFIAFNGDMDTSIIIRTYTIKGKTVSFQTGGAIVLDSDPVAEYQETLDKAYALKKTLESEPLL